MFRFLSSMIIALMPLSAPAGEIDPELMSEARALANEFVAALKPQLKGALQGQGPAGAIAVCADVAPQLADSLSRTSGWAVKRVSLKNRNASRAVPDAWEARQLARFDTQAKAADKDTPLEHGEQTGSHFRYMKAQRVEPVCLVCHGQELSAEVIRALDTYYPDDIATGYVLGDVRGAISLSRRSANPR
mgnify:CR=1 FL=1